VEEEYTSWMYQAKTKKKKLPGKKIVSFVVVVGFLALSVLGIKSIFFDDNNFEQPALTFKNTSLQEEAVSGEIENNKSELTQETKLPPAPIEKKAIIETSNINKEKSLPEVSNEDIKTTETQTTTDVAGNNEVVAKEEESSVAQSTKEKKKTFKETINDLFKKKKKDEVIDDKEIIVEQRTTTNNNGERVAKKRGEEPSGNTTSSSSPELVNITNEVEVRMNMPQNWMIGVKDLKVTLQNKSSLSLKNASVEVLYYTEQNNLIEKKTIQFTNIAAGKSKTLAAPDHRLADHAEVKVVSASGVEIAFAKN
jgi:hypothetical protein